MTMALRLRKFALTLHVAFSVGWSGAVFASLALGVVGVTSQDPRLVRAVYQAMEPLGWYVLVPLSLASLATGLVVSLGTRWGLFRHYWVLVKLIINVFASVILLLYMQTLGYLADVAVSGDLRELRGLTAVIHGGGALVLLLGATALSVYKPRGMTRYGRRKQREQRAESRPQSSSLVPTDV